MFNAQSAEFVDCCILGGYAIRLHFRNTRKEGSVKTAKAD